MADSTNTNSARSFHGGGTPRRSSGPGYNQRVMNSDIDYRRYRGGYNFQSQRSNGRARGERPPHSSNRNGNRDRGDSHRSTYYRSYNSDYYNLEQGFSSNMSLNIPNIENGREHQNVDQEMNNIRGNGDCISGNVNNVDQENNSDLLGRLYSIDRNQYKKSSRLIPMGLPASSQNGEQQHFENAKKEEKKLDDAHTKAQIRASSRPSSSEPSDNPSAMTDYGLGLPDSRYPSSDNLPQNLPRAIKGRITPDGAESLLMLNSISEQDSTSITDSNATSNLPHTVTSGALHKEWANAPEFIPKGSKPRSYAEVVTPKLEHPDAAKKLCPYAEKRGSCRVPPGVCPYLHGDLCELCGNAALHPQDEEQRKQHHQKCLAQHERDMELSFAIARSKGKTCGICFEVVLEKQYHERRFGILTQCNHCFCLNCIRTWRQARQFEHKVIRACPECRVTSDFVCPSAYWVETKEEKDKLIQNYKNALAEKQCKYFKQGRGSCPFGNKCFYLHALPDGTKTDVGPPPRRRRNQRQRRGGDDAEIGDMLQIILWDFLDEHDHYWLYSLADDIEELAAFFSDSDDSELSDYEFLFE